MKYLLSYDLIAEKNYKYLYQELHKFNATRVLESQWVFTHDGLSPKLAGKIRGVHPR